MSPSDNPIVFECPTSSRSGRCIYLEVKPDGWVHLKKIRWGNDRAEANVTAIAFSQGDLMDLREAIDNVLVDDKEDK